MVRTSGARGYFSNVLSVSVRSGIGVLARRYGVPNAAHARRSLACIHIIAVPANYGNVNVNLKKKILIFSPILLMVIIFV